MGKYGDRLLLSINERTSLSLHFSCFLVLLLAATIASSCRPKPEAVIDTATVVANNASVRMSNSSASRTLTTLNSGEKLDILEKKDNWYRVRLGDRLQGWMEESTILTKTSLSRIREMAAGAQGQPVQNTAVLRNDANFRLEPGRFSEVIRRLKAGTKVEVLERVTTPRPGDSGAYDVWLKARISPTEAGWVYGRLVEFDVPAGIAPYTEERVYPAVRIINRVEDPLEGTVNWFVVGEKKPSLHPTLDFDGIRVFTWNLGKHRYETAFRLKDLRGVYPLELGSDKGNPTFRFYELSEDGQQKIPRDFVMRGVIVRELQHPSGNGAAHPHFE